MIKLVNLLKRNPGMSLEEFIDYYENVHRKIGEKYISKYALNYVRRFLRPIPKSIFPEEMVRNYDVITELWFPDQKALEGCFAELATPEAKAELEEATAKLFDLDNMHFFIAEEYESDLGNQPG